MIDKPIYMDNHATTRTDPRVVEAMLPFFGETYGNAGSTTHEFGHLAKDAVDRSRSVIAVALGARAREIVFTSGATESNNLALVGVAQRHAKRGRHLISVATEHPSVLDPLAKLAECGYEVTLLPVVEAPDPRAGLLDVDRLADAIRDDTILVSVMLANNEVGVIQPLVEIGRLCRERDVLLHTDATQAVGKMPIDVSQLGVDLMSLTAHKIYGPKGIGALYVRGRPRVRLESFIDGGGQEFGLRSGTLNVPGIVGFARAVELAVGAMPEEPERLRGLRDRLFAGLKRVVPDVVLNGPALDPPEWRLPNNLNVSIPLVDGEALLVSMRDVAVSTGSACASADPEPSHVLRALGLSQTAARSSVRFGLGRFSTEEEVDFATGLVGDTVARLRQFSSMA